MKFKSFLALLLASMASLLVASCGGGGASVDTNRGGDLSISPSSTNPGTFYAGVPSTITISGGRVPYSLTSTDPGILPVPAILNGHSFQVVPANPGVVDPGLTADDVPRRTVQIIVRDTLGNTVIGEVRVMRNFLTGYVVQFLPSTCPAATPICAGGDTIVRFQAIISGALHGNEQFKLEIIRSGCRFLDFDNVLKAAVFVQSDHSGVVQALMRCPANSPPSIGLLRVTHIASGVNTDTAFLISSAGANSPVMTADPAKFTFTGPFKGVCGTGSFDVLIFGGQAPYTASSASPNAVSVTPSTSTSTPGRFTITAFNSATCVDTTVVVQDATGGHVDINVVTEEGSTDPPAPPTPATFDVQPAAIVLNCGTTGSVTAVGGSGTYAATSTHPRVFAAVAGNTISITRCGTGAADPRCSLPPGVAGGGDGGINYPITGTVSVTDGTGIKPVALSGWLATCP